METEIDSAYMCSKRKVYFIGIFTFPMNDYSMSNKKFGGIISDKFRPYFLFYKVRLIAMVITYPDCIFKSSERRFYRPYADILEMPTFDFLKY